MERGCACDKQQFSQLRLSRQRSVLCGVRRGTDVGLCNGLASPEQTLSIRGRWGTRTLDLSRVKAAL